MHAHHHDQHPSFPQGTSFGAGHMAALVAARDWSETPLGAVDAWPEALKTAIAIVLRSTTPMVLLWGGNGMFFYNDAYAALACDEQGHLLGRSLQDCNAQLAEFHESGLRAGLGGQTLAYRDHEVTLRRDGRDTRAIVDLEYWPLTGERGAALGVLGTVIERTPHVLAERRLRETAERFRALLVASTTSMYRMSADWSEMHQLDGRGFLSDTLEPRRDWLQSYIPPDERPRVLAAIAEAIHAKSVFDLEHRVRLPDGGDGWTHSKAAPILDDRGDILEWFGAASDVTERKRMEDALRASEERFRLLYGAQHTAHIVLAPDFTIEAVSAPYLAATMTREEDLIGKKLFDAFPDNPGDPTATGVHNLSASLAWVLKHGQPHRMAVQKYDVRGPTGEFELRWWAPLNIPVLGPDGSVRHIIHQVEDVTREMLEREKVVEAQAREARFREVADAIPGLVFETDLMARNTFVNERYQAYTGFSFEALLGEGWHDVLHPDDRERAGAAWREAARSSHPFELECRIRRADGEWRWFMLRISAVCDADGGIKKGIGVAFDIEDAKRAESALRDREEQFRSMADSLPQLAWMADEKGWIYWYNRRWYEYTGASEADMVGWGWRKVHHPDHVGRVVERIRHSWDTGEPWEDTFPLRRADGHYRVFLSRATPLKDAEGRVIRWFGTNTDITERQKREDFQKLLLHEVSHRVKNSLAMVSGLLELQARNLNGVARQTLEDASIRVRTVAKVHEHLWPQSDAREINLAPFLSNLAAAIATTAPRHRTSVDVHSAIVSADAAVPIGLLVNELATNAYKHAYAPGKEGEVRISGKCVGAGRYRLEIADSGRGLPHDFDLDLSRSSLGMRVITSLASQLGGSLSVDGGQAGTRVAVEFPVKDPA